MTILAQLNDADTELTLTTKGPHSFKVTALSGDGVNAPTTTHDSTHGSLSDAIKAIMVFFVGEWEPVQNQGHLKERLMTVIEAVKVPG